MVLAMIINILNMVIWRGVATKTLQALHKGMQELEEELKYQKSFLGKVQSFIAKIRAKINNFLKEEEIIRHVLRSLNVP